MTQKSPISLGPRWGGCLSLFVGLGFIGGGTLLLLIFLAVRDLDTQKRLLISILPIICIVIGIFSLWRGIHYRRMAWIRVPRSRSDSGRRYARSPADLPAEPGPVTLKPDASRWLKFVATAGLCVVLSGLAIWVYLADGTVAIPLVLGGLLMVAPALYNGLAIFSPHVIVTLSSHPVRVGGRVEVSWQTEGFVGRMRRLTIAVEAQETACQAGAEAPPPESSPFYRQIVMDTDQQTKMRSGTCSFELPTTLPPTLDTGYNEIAWCLRVRGEIPWAANINDSYEFSLLG